MHENGKLGDPWKHSDLACKDLHSLRVKLEMVFACRVLDVRKSFADLHCNYFLNVAASDEPNCVRFALFSCKLEPVGCIEFTVLNDAVIVFVDKQSDPFAFSILWADIDVVLFPIDIDIAPCLLIINSLDYKIDHMRDIKGKHFRIFTIEKANAISDIRLLLLNFRFHVYL